MEHSESESTDEHTGTSTTSTTAGKKVEPGVYVASAVGGAALLGLGGFAVNRLAQPSSNLSASAFQLDPDMNNEMQDTEQFTQFDAEMFE